MIQLSVEKNFLIMEDRKFVDISSIVMKQFKTLSSWVDLVTVHGSVNQEVLKKLNGIVIVSNMSNNNWNFDKQSLCYGFLEHERVVGFVTQYDLFSKQRSDGRDLRVAPWESAGSFPLGYHYWMRPEDCRQGIDRLANGQYRMHDEYYYPDLSKLVIG